MVAFNWAWLLRPLPAKSAPSGHICGCVLPPRTIFSPMKVRMVRAKNYIFLLIKRRVGCAVDAAVPTSLRIKVNRAETVHP